MRVPIPCSVGDVTLNNCERHLSPILAQFLYILGRSLAANCLKFVTVATRLFVESVRDCSANQRVVKPSLGSSQFNCIPRGRGTVRFFRRWLGRLRKGGRGQQRDEKAREKPATTVGHE